jgi:hypothetical protein
VGLPTGQVAEAELYPYYVPKDPRMRRYLERQLIWLLFWIVAAFAIVAWDFCTNTLWMLL